MVGIRYITKRKRKDRTAAMIGFSVREDAKTQIAMQASP